MCCALLPRMRMNRPRSQGMDVRVAMWRNSARLFEFSVAGCVILSCEVDSGQRYAGQCESRRLWPTQLSLTVSCLCPQLRMHQKAQNSTSMKAALLLSLSAAVATTQLCPSPSTPLSTNIHSPPRCTAEPHSAVHFRDLGYVASRLLSCADTDTAVAVMAEKSKSPWEKELSGVEKGQCTASNIRPHRAHSTSTR